MRIRSSEENVCAFAAERITSLVPVHKLTIGFLGAAFTALLCLAVSGQLARADGPRSPGRYTVPPASYILSPTETPITLQFGQVPLAQVQAQLNAASAANANSPIILTLTGTYWVTDTPLSLPSNTSLVLYGTIEAGFGAKAKSLISISGQSKVGIAGGVLEGNFANLAGIDAENSSKIEIDHVTVEGTRMDGIILSGPGDTTFDSGSTITRCDVSFALGNGITVENITQALLLDNSVHDNLGTGIAFSAAHSSIVNNSVRQNRIGIYASGNNDLISDNNLSGNLQAGLQTASTSSSTVALRNIIAGNLLVGADFDGTNNLLYSNTFANRNNLIDRSTANWIVPREMALTATNSQYFYPPSIDNQQTGTIVNGMGRTDITVTSEDLTAVQTAYNTARQANPNNVIVLHMNGTFTADTAPLTLGPYTAVLLNGTITMTKKLSEAIVGTSPDSFVSISGGAINLNGFSTEGVDFEYAKMINIDHLTVENGGIPTHRSSETMIHLRLDHVSDGGYDFLYRNTVNEGGGRCIWTESPSASYIVMENTSSNCNEDGVDFDAETSNSYAIDNTGIDNERYGVFIEQSDVYDTVYGQYTTTKGLAPDEPGHGVGVYNNATSAGTRGPTDGNTVFSSTSDTIQNGLRIGSIASHTGGVAETAHTFMFDNIALNSRDWGILFDTEFSGSIDNLISQTTFANNGTDVDTENSNGAEPPDFFNPRSAIDLALNKTATASSTAPGSSAAYAVDGLAFTGWQPAGHGMVSLTVDLGAAESFQRVTLKRAVGLGMDVVKLESSNDGVTFTQIPYQITTFGSVDMLQFHPVTARYVRLEVWNPIGIGNSLEEVSVYPE
jgi:F5/8 type C domain/Periplasmic copper-binding protein (NosD)